MRLLFWVDDGSPLEKPVSASQPLVIGRELFSDHELEHFPALRGISRQHARISYHGYQWLIEDLNSTNGTRVSGEQLTPGNQASVAIGGTFFIGQIKVSLVEAAETSKPNSGSTNAPNAATPELAKLKLQGNLVVGRDPSCDWVISSPVVSRRHAEFTWQGDQAYVADLGSTNGTYVNGVQITAKTAIKPDDEVSLGHEVIYLFGVPLKEIPGLVIEGMGKTFAKGQIGLHPINLVVKKGEMVGVMGPSGCGKSTFLKALVGEAPATSGRILLKGHDFMANYDRLKTLIGYVPQDDILHKDLTVYQSLYFTARLRLPDPDEALIKERIQLVLERLKVLEVQHKKIKELSGGQRKRVCIASELLTDPEFLFLDEPTSPLDPQTIVEFMQILQGLSAAGTTIIMVTHKPDDLIYLQKVLFLARGGKGVFYGDATEVKNYFSVANFPDIYLKVEQDGATWVNKFAQTQQGEGTAEGGDQIRQMRAGIFRQIFWLTRRNFRIALNDPASLMVPLLGPPAIAFVFATLYPEVTLQVLFLMSVTAIFFGLFGTSGEIVKELSIYIRERMFNLRIGPYIASKLVVLILFSVIQAVLTTLVIQFKFDASGADIPLHKAPELMLWMSVTFFASGVLGLFLSSLFSKPEKVNLWVPYVVLLQIILSGVMTKIRTEGGQAASSLMFSRWSTEVMSRVQDTVGYDRSLMDHILETTTPPMPTMPSNTQQPSTTTLPDSLSMSQRDTTQTQPEATSTSITVVEQTKDVKESKDSTKKEKAHFIKQGAPDLLVQNFPDSYRNRELAYFGKYAHTKRLNAFMLFFLTALFLGGTWWNLKRKDRG